MTDFSAMSGPELVREYNRMATARGLPLVKRFSTTDAGVRRCAALENGTPRTRAPLDLLTEFKTSTRKFRGKLLQELADHKGAQVALVQLLRAVYGSPNLTNRGALSMVMRGLEQSIKKDHLPYRIEKLKSETGVASYGLYDKS